MAQWEWKQCLLADAFFGERSYISPLCSDKKNQKNPVNSVGDTKCRDIF